MPSPQWARIAKGTGLNRLYHDGYILVGADCPLPVILLRENSDLGDPAEISDNRSMM